MYTHVCPRQDMDEAIKEQDRVLPLSPTLFETMTRCLLRFLPSWLAHSFWDSRAFSSHLTSSSLGLQIMCYHTEIYMMSYHCSIAVKAYHDQGST